MKKTIEIAGLVGTNIGHINPEELEITGERLDNAGDNLWPIICAIASGSNPTRFSREEGMTRLKAEQLFASVKMFIIQNLSPKKSVSPLRRIK